MTDCAARFEELTHTADVIREEDLQALRRMDERDRIERYNDIKADEEEFRWEFSEKCPNFLTQSERERIRGNFRLARLLLAASLCADDDLPRPLSEDFVEAELQAVVDFDRYRQFDALSEEQIERKIRRMDGEVYELVTEYTSTQLANVEELLEHPEVQQDVMERLLDRYEKRREKIRRGFFTYVESQGLEHTVEAIEDAVTAVAEAGRERAEIADQLETTREELADEIRSDFQRERERLESQIEHLEQRLRTETADTESLESQVEDLEAQLEEATASQDDATSEIDASIEFTAELEQRIEAKIEQLQETRKETLEEATEVAAENARELVEDELDSLQKQREQLQTELERLQREREKIGSARESLQQRQEGLEQRVAQVTESLETPEEGLKGENVVTAKMARLFEMDYIGRFDTSMHEAETVHTPDGPFRVPDGYWKNRSERRSNRGYIQNLLEADNPGLYPANASSRYEITESSVLGLGSTTEMVLEARVVSNLHAYAENGFNAAPAGVDPVLSIANDVVTEAEDGEYEYILALASPTGWSEQVEEELLDGKFATMRYSRYLSLCLVDLQDGSVLYDESDGLLRENIQLFELHTDSERVAACVETIREEYVEDIGQESVLLRDVVSEYDFDQQTVKRAFNQLEEEDAGEQLYLDELGMSLNVRK